MLNQQREKGKKNAEERVIDRLINDEAWQSEDFKRGKKIFDNFKNNVKKLPFVVSGKNGYFKINNNIEEIENLMSEMANINNDMYWFVFVKYNFNDNEEDLRNYSDYGYYTSPRVPNNTPIFFKIVGLIIGRFLTKKYSGEFLIANIPIGYFISFLILNWNRRNTINRDDLFYYVMYDLEMNDEGKINKNIDINSIKVQLYYNIFSDDISDLDTNEALRWINNRSITYIIEKLLFHFYSQNDNSDSEFFAINCWTNFFEGVTSLIRTSSDRSTLCEFFSPFDLINYSFVCDIAQAKEKVIGNLESSQYLARMRHNILNDVGQTETFLNGFTENVKTVIRELSDSQFESLSILMTGTNCPPSGVRFDLYQTENGVPKGHTCFNSLDLPFRGRYLRSVGFGGINDWPDNALYDTLDKVRAVFTSVL